MYVITSQTSLFTGNVKTYYSTWIIGDHFLREVLQELFNIHDKAIKANQDIPYLFQHFNVDGFYTSRMGISNVINQFLYTLTDALNENLKLPKYFIMIPDKDLLPDLENKNRVSMAIGAILHSIICQTDIIIARHKKDLREKRLGAVIGEEFLKIIWVHMLKHPQSCIGAFALQGKFNSILEECLLDGSKECHRIMSIDIDLNEFDYSGGLTQTGMNAFWKEVNRAMSKFDTGKITLKPRKFITKQQQSPKKRKLSTPPPKERERTSRFNIPLKRWKSRHHSRGYSRSPKRHPRSRSRSRSLRRLSPPWCHSSEISHSHQHNSIIHYR